jgi:hypothetical protein
VLKIKLNFENLVRILKQFKLNCAPSRESEIEFALVSFLKSRGFSVKQQICIPNGRLDVVVDNYIIEVKLNGTKGIVEQLDKYSGYCDGLIVVCWKASQPLKMIFAAEKKSSKIPVELVEVRSACGMIRQKIKHIMEHLIFLNQIMRVVTVVAETVGL